MRYRRALAVVAYSFACLAGGQMGYGQEPPRPAGADLRKFGVHEIVLKGNAAVANPFDTVATVTFTPPSGAGKAKTVWVFHDGGNTWRARVYISEPGRWTWASHCTSDRGLNGKSGEFVAVDSPLRGRLVPDAKNPRQWRTEDGRWFLNLNDTAYSLFSTHYGRGKPIPFEDVADYVRDLETMGITSVRCNTARGAPLSSSLAPSERDEWSSLFTDRSHSRLRLDNLQSNDRRFFWLLDNHPDMYVQFILFPRGSQYAKDETAWRALGEPQKERLLRNMLARYAAFPQIFWLTVNDAHYGDDFPANNTFAREVGRFFQKHDPWQHPMSAGHARRIPFYFGGEDWATYIHLEDEADLSAEKYKLYHHLAKPVFLGEDRYEQDHGPVRDPADMRYFQRRLFWSWLLAGGSANYGGRHWVIQPYKGAAQQPIDKPGRGKETLHFAKGLTGLDSVPYIARYFYTRQIDLPGYEPQHELVTDVDKPRTEGLKLMRHDASDYIIYHPNAAKSGIEATANTGHTARMTVDLSQSPGRFLVEWYRPEDGTTHDGGTIDGGKQVELTSPWKGCDVVVRLTARQTEGK